VKGYTYTSSSPEPPFVVDNTGERIVSPSLDRRTWYGHLVHMSHENDGLEIRKGSGPGVETSVGVDALDFKDVGAEERRKREERGEFERLKRRRRRRRRELTEMGIRRRGSR